MNTSDAPRFSSQTIRSFVLRQGRMSDAQQRYIDELMPRYGVPYQTQTPDWHKIFGRQAPMVVEVGFGMGMTTVEIAKQCSDTDFLGIEVHGPGVGNACKLIEAEKVSNLRITQHDAVEVMQNMIAPDSLAGVHVFFPDPWPKKRHRKRRILQPEFVTLIASRLKPGGYLHCATDWQEYAEYMLTVLNETALLQNTSTDESGYVPRPAYRPRTKFEERGLRLGHGVWDLIFTRRPL